MTDEKIMNDINIGMWTCRDCSRACVCYGAISTNEKGKGFLPNKCIMSGENVTWEIGRASCRERV